jgi:polysaccharide deacetylase 2 family uncharacterized protein YibQ
MSQTDAFSLPPRRETFLARYPRNYKLGATVVLIALLVLPPAWIHGQVHHAAGSAASDPDENDKNMPERESSVVQTDINAAALNDQNDRSVKLSASPDSRLSDDTALGSLPRIGVDGSEPWRVYARPFNAQDHRPRIAIVVTGLGLSREITDEFISQLPPTVTLSFDGQGAVVGAWIARARQDGHESILEVPMEPFDYPRSDPGPDTLLASLPNSDNISRLYMTMRHANGYVGITTLSGSRLTTDPGKLSPILQVLHDRGLMILDARAAPHSAVTDMAREAGVPVATLTRRLDNDLSPEAISTALNDLEKSAILNGRAVGVTAATPVMLDQLQRWTKELPQHGIALAPASALVR